MNKIIFFLFLSLSLYGLTPIKIEKEYYNYEKYNRYDCRIESRIIYFYKNKYTGKISKDEYHDMTYKCYHGMLYFKPGGYSYTYTQVKCECFDKRMWVEDEGNLN